MKYRERVAIHAPTRSQGPTGQSIDTYGVVAGMESVPASIITSSPRGVRLGQEAHLATMTVTEEEYEVILGGHHPQITTLMRVVAGNGRWFDIISVAATLDRRGTILLTRRVDPAGTT